MQADNKTKVDERQRDGERTIDQRATNEDVDVPEPILALPQITCACLPTTSFNVLRVFPGKEAAC